MLSESEIKLIRTDTTLDLSQKAEKVCFSASELSLYVFPLIIVYRYGFLDVRSVENIHRRRREGFNFFSLQLPRRVTCNAPYIQKTEGCTISYSAYFVPLL